MRQSCVVVDYDGTLADLTHRLHYIQGPKKNYDKFFSEVFMDNPKEDIIQLVEHLYNCGETIFIVSGRSDVCFQESVDWLKKWKEGDYRPDTVVKREILSELREKGYEPWLAIDDRTRLAKMWRKENITTLLVDDWEDRERSTAKGNPNLYIMVGPSGSGKTTWLEENLPNVYRVSSDDMRFYLTGDYKDQTKNADVFAACHGVINQLLLNGVGVAFDATNIRNKDRKAVVDAAPAGVTIHYVVIDRPLEDKLETSGWRLEVPNLIERHHNTMQSNIKEILRGDGLDVTVLDRRV